tara:strand:+ start:413 stop:580 length:168 start_codon:yes stop_codon:yes gene_type:complete
MAGFLMFSEELAGLCQHEGTGKIKQFVELPDVGTFIEDVVIVALNHIQNPPVKAQ